MNGLVELYVVLPTKVYCGVVWCDELRSMVGEYLRVRLECAAITHVGHILRTDAIEFIHH